MSRIKDIAILILSAFIIGAAIFRAVEADAYPRNVFLQTGRIFAEVKGVKAPDDILKSIYSEATRQKLSPYWVLAQCWAESELDPYCISKAGAQGLMQIMVKYWGELFTDTNISAIYNVQQNVNVGCCIMRDFSKNSGVYRGLIRYNGGSVREGYHSVEVTPESFYYAEKIVNTLNEILLIQGYVISYHIDLKKNKK
jgi:soluble lytic murein transglycosylase-like protein